MYSNIRFMQTKELSNYFFLMGAMNINDMIKTYKSRNFELFINLRHN